MEAGKSYLQYSKQLRIILGKMTLKIFIEILYHSSIHRNPLHDLQNNVRQFGQRNYNWRTHIVCSNNYRTIFTL